MPTKEKGAAIPIGYLQGFREEPDYQLQEQCPWRRWISARNFPTDDHAAGVLHHLFPGALAWRDLLPITHNQIDALNCRLDSATSRWLELAGGWPTQPILTPEGARSKLRLGGHGGDDDDLVGCPRSLISSAPLITVSPTLRGANKGAPPVVSVNVRRQTRVILPV